MRHTVFVAALLIAALISSVRAQVPPSRSLQLKSAGTAPASNSKLNAGHAETEALKTAREEARTWLEEAKILTAEIQADYSGLEPYDETIIWARLGVIWWDTDQRNAEQMMKMALSNVSRAQQNERIEHKATRLKAFGLVLTIAAPFMKMEVDELLPKLEEQLDELIRTPEGKQSARQVGYSISSGLAVIGQRSDPQWIANMTRLKLRAAADSTNLQTALLQLSSSPATARSLYEDAISLASQGNDSLFWDLMQSTRFDTEDPRAKVITPELKQQAATALRDRFLRPGDAAEGTTSCDLATTVRMSLNSFDVSDRALLEQKVAECKRMDEQKRPDAYSVNVLDPELTVDELERMVAEERNVRNRYTLREQTAMRIMAREKDPLRALRLWDNITQEERDSEPSWAEQRFDVVRECLSLFYKQHNFKAFEDMIVGSPDEIRSKTALEAVALLLSHEEKQWAVLFLITGRKALTEHPSEDTGLYLQLANFYHALLPAEDGQVLREVIAGLNVAPVYEDEPGLMWPKHDKKRLHHFPFWRQLMPVHLPSTLNDPRISRLVIDTLKYPQGRQCLRLGMLKAEIERHEQAQKHVAQLTEALLKRDETPAASRETEPTSGSMKNVTPKVSNETKAPTRE